MSCSSCEKKFREIEEKKEEGGFLKKSIGMVQSYASSLASKGFSSKRIAKPSKQLRVVSCFGNEHFGGELPACQHLTQSKTPGKHFCGGCGCGDREQTWLMAEGDNYSKLDFPKLACPLNMPGFTNYKPSEPDESEMPITRKYYIENMDYDIINKVEVSLPDPKTKEEE